MKLFTTITLFLALFLTTIPGYTTTEEHGPIIKFLYAPWGLVGMTLPYASGNTVSSQKTYSTSGTAFYDYYSGFAFTGGYYYDFLQCEARYSSAKISNREVALANQRTEPVSANYSFFDLKAGIRFSKPGDSSYGFLYAGAKKTYFKSPFSDTNADTLGYIFGFSGFKSIGMVSSIEFVLFFDVYAGSASYDYNHIEFDATFSAEEKTSYDFGLSSGIGLQYEPYNITCLFKVTSEFHINEHKSGDDRVGASIYGAHLGIELIYTLPSIKYNRVDKQ